MKYGDVNFVNLFSSDFIQSTSTAQIKTTHLRTFILISWLQYFVEGVAIYAREVAMLVEKCVNYHVLSVKKDAS